MTALPFSAGSFQRAPNAARPMTPGAGLAILVNANAKRGGRRIAAQLRGALPGANVRLTKHAKETDAWLLELPDRSCVLAAGGDGTAMGLVNALDRVTPEGQPLPPIGILPVGTGNAWARNVGARKLGWCVERLVAHDGPLPFRRYGLVEVEGTLAHFAGCGWDSQILEDFRAQLEAAKGPSKRAAKSVYGYLSAMALRTVPRILLHGRPNVIVENLGDDVYTMSADGKIVKVAGMKHGAVIFEGPASVAGAATCPEFGYRFRAYPFAERMLGWINIRIYEVHVLKGVATIPQLWRGAHPMRGMHDWFVQAARMTFSRPVALQIGGDACGMRRTVEYSVSPREVPVLEWRRMVR
jgi:diacylglycerol kinase family enzyme